MALSEDLENAECPDCGHGAFYHHPIGQCGVTTYGPPEDGFQPSEPCRCDTPFGDALAPTVARIVAERVRAVEARLGRVEAVLGECEEYDAPDQDCITAGPEVFALEACAPCRVRAALGGLREEASNAGAGGDGGA